MPDVKKCPACAEEVKAEANVCRFCGYDFELKKSGAEAAAKRKKDSDDKAKGIGCLVLIGLAGLVYFFTLPSAEEKAATAQAEVEKRTKGFHCLSAWDGSNRSLVDQVKAGLRDPESFEHVETKITPATGPSKQHNIIMQYRARNGFGGMNAGSAIGTVDPNSCEATIVENADLSRS